MKITNEIKSMVMRMAWGIAREAVVRFGGSTRMYIAESMRMAWKNYQSIDKLTLEEKIDRLERRGFKRWTKNGMDRLYVNPTSLGLEVGYYNTGNVRSAKLNGNVISNCRARRALASKTYVDLKDWTLHSTCAESEIVARAAELAGIAV